MTAVAEKQVAPWVGALTAAEPKFRELAKLHDVSVNWEAEASFARQIIERNAGVAKCDPKSIRDAVINVGAMGLSLNPAKNEVYLVPRGNVCTAAISYIGYNNIAIASGVVEHIRADLVYAEDDFTYNGPSEKCVHSTKTPFDLSKRGAIVGVYAQAKLASGDWLTEIMNMQDIEAVKKASRASSGPWVSFYGEMCRKSVMRRLFKTLPKSGNTKALVHAMHVSDEHEGLEDSVVAWQPSYTADEHERFHKAIEDSNGIDLFIMSQTCADAAWIDLYASFPKGKKVSGKELANKLEATGREACQDAANQLDQYFPSDDAGANEILNEFSDSELECVFAFCTNETVQWSRELLKEAG